MNNCICCKPPWRFKDADPYCTTRKLDSSFNEVWRHYTGGFNTFGISHKDSSNRLWVAGNGVQFAGTGYANVYEVDNDGGATERRIDLSGGSGHGAIGVELNSSEQIIAYADGVASSTSGYCIAAYSQTLAELWNDDTFGTRGEHMAIDPDNDGVLLAGTGPDASPDPVLVYYNSSGVIQWTYTESLSGLNTGGTSCAFYDDGTKYILFSTQTSGTDKVRRNLFSDRSSDWDVNAVLDKKSLAVDSNGNVYTISGFGTLSKYNSSGTFQSSTTPYSGLNVLYAITIDSSDNIYVCGDSATDVGGGTNSVWKYNTSLTIQSVRFDHGGPTRDLKVDSSGNVYITGDRVLL